MTFTIAIPTQGYSGWRFLERTYDSQLEMYSNSAQTKRETEYFLANIQNVKDAKSLVSDRILLKIALGAFGLGDELNKSAFIEKVLAEGTTRSDSLANKLVDTRYRELSRMFGFEGDGQSNLGRAGFGQKIVADYKKQQLEIIVGNSDNNLRLAMTFKRQIGKLAGSEIASGTAWFQLMGNPAMRRFFEIATNLPSNIGKLDVDRQRGIFQEKSRQMLGSASLTMFRDPKYVEKITRMFFAGVQVQSLDTMSNGGNTALRLLSNIPRSFLIKSNFA